MKSLLSLVLVCCALSSLFAQSSGTGRLNLDFQAQFSGEPIVLGKRLFHSPTGDSLYLDVFRFYVSGIQLKGSKAVFSEKDSYHLLDAEEAGSLSIVLKNVPVGPYDSLIFYVGTDSLTNVSGAMGGDLDPTLGMYWAWNTGYINVKIEGRSNSCNTRYHGFEFHFGGYMPPNQTVRRVVLPLKALTVQTNQVDGIKVHTELSRFFSNFKLETTNQVMIPSATAAQLADYFQGIFSTH